MKTRILFSFIIVHTLLCTFPSYSTALSPEQNGFDTVIQEAKKGGYNLINIDELWGIYQKQQSDLVLVDTRQEWEYLAGYIKGAKNFSMEPTWLARMTRRGALEQFLGPDKTKTFVFY